ncbi:MAG: hypothetical protein EBZ48_05820 [Proteobacteria bacterium]|nr:hypothetical protein [Pseudomonadota bacterium]
MGGSPSAKACDEAKSLAAKAASCVTSACDPKTATEELNQACSTPIEQKAVDKLSEALKKCEKVPPSKSSGSTSWD